MRPSQNIVQDFLHFLLEGLQYEKWQSVFEVFKVISLVLSVIFAILFVIALINVWPLRPKIRLFFKGKDTRQRVLEEKEKRKIRVKDSQLKERWMNILQKLDPKSHDSMMLAIIAADKLVDDALKKVGFVGDTMADRLKQFSPSEMKSLEELWDAHKLRNELVHQPNFEFSVKDATRALKSYETFLKELELLD